MNSTHKGVRSKLGVGVNLEAVIIKQLLSTALCSFNVFEPANTDN